MVDLETISDAFSSLGHALGTLLHKIFGSRNERVVARFRKRIAAINTHTEWAAGLTEEQVKEQTAQWRQAVADGTPLDEFLPQAFAMVREVAERTLGLRPYDVQLVGAMVLHDGSIAEMATGEGKTLVATLPAYLNALAGKVYVVTVNDYLARRDAEWMKPVFDYLGVQVGSIQSHMTPQERHPVYAGDILYGTNNEFGFDYLRDNMKSRVEDQVQKQLGFAIIDEVDSILIDEARTPLIISGPPTGDAERYRRGIQLARRLKKELHFELKEKEKQAVLSEDGIVEAQKLTGIEDFYSSAEHMEWPHVFEQCLRALHLYHADVEYVAKDGQIIIVDEFTGRLMEGRRWGDGLHQAVEAKEGIRPRAQNQTLATITFQNYFRLFHKLSGMTGTALTEAGEFARIYDLDVVAIPTNRPIARKDNSDVVFLTEKDKWLAIAAEIEDVHAKGQPVLVGTTSIEHSELLAGMLKRRGLKHEVLNAKQHEREAEIVALAGRRGAVTVATNMAGRGTDIKLGGNVDVMFDKALAEKEFSPDESKALREKIQAECDAEREQVLAAGGLYVLGTERHEARRIDNQLRGRSGRQGDAGFSRFFLSLDDDLMKRFYRDWVKNFLSKAGMGDGEPVESRIVSRAIEKAQKKVEAYHFEIRKNLIEYDEVMNEQRQLIYDQRQDALEGVELSQTLRAMFSEACDKADELYGGDGKEVPPDFDALAQWGSRKWGWEGSTEELSKMRFEDALQLLHDFATQALELREAELGEEALTSLQRFLILNAIDNKWKEHLLTMDSLRSGVGLRSYAQVDPKTEYKREGLEQFKKLLDVIAEEVTNYILRVQIKVEDETRIGSAYQGAQASHPSFGGGPASPNEPQRRKVAVGYDNPSQTHAGNPYASQQRAMDAASAPMGERPAEAAPPKIARNAPCPCGSGKKYKRCCGAV